MKKFCTLIVTVGVLLAARSYASVNIGDTGTLTLNLGTYQYGNGGEFVATPTSAAIGSSLGTAFQTFCLEYNEEFTPSSTTVITYQVNTGAVAGGGGADTVNNNPLTPLGSGQPMDTLSVGTAWLYSQFRTGGLTISSKSDAGNLQDAIWYLECEQASPIFNSANGTNDINLAEDAIYGSHGTAAALAAIEANSTSGEFGVYALNLFYVNGKNVVNSQDQLYYDTSYQTHTSSVPEPSTVLAGALLLLPLGVSAIRILRKSKSG